MENEVEKRKEKIKEKFSNWLKDPYNKAILFIIIIAFIIRFIILLKTLNQPMWFDEASYMATAKKWGLGLDINEVWYYRRGFLLPLISSIFFKLGFGEIGIRFLEAVFSISLIFISYLIIKDMFDKEKALFVSICLTFLWVILFFTGRAMTEIPAAFFILLALLFFWKGYVKNQGKIFFWLFGAFFALSVLTRMQYLMFAPVFLIYAFSKEKFKFLKNKYLWFAVLAFFLVLLPHIILYWNHFGNPVTDILSHYFGIQTSATIETGSQAKDFFNYFKDLPYALDGTTFSSFFKPFFFLFLIGIFYFFADLILGFDNIFKSEEIKKKLLVFSWIVIPFLILGYMTQSAEQRYTMPIYPFIFLIASVSFFKIRDYLCKNKTKSCIILGFIVLIVLLIPNLLWGFQLTDAKKTSYLEVQQAGLWLKQNSNPGDIIVTSSYPQISYYSERTVALFDSDKPEGGKALNETQFDEFVRADKPKYLMLSAFEHHPDWAYAYPQKHNDTWIPVQAYYQGQQPVVVIYKSKD